MKEHAETGRETRTKESPFERRAKEGGARRSLGVWPHQWQHVGSLVRRWRCRDVWMRGRSGEPSRGGGDLWALCRRGEYSAGSPTRARCCDVASVGNS